MVQQPPNDWDDYKPKGHYDIGKVGVAVRSISFVFQLQSGCAQIKLYTEHLQYANNLSVRSSESSQSKLVYYAEMHSNSCRGSVAVPACGTHHGVAARYQFKHALM